LLVVVVSVVAAVTTLPFGSVVADLSGPHVTRGSAPCPDGVTVRVMLGVRPDDLLCVLTMW
jgi:hypothetical protein